MIFVSTACVKAETISESVITLAKVGFKNIELSGGTKYYANYENDLLRLQDKYALNYQVHNYFPPSEKPFVLNLASMDDEICGQSIQLCKRAIRLSKRLGGKRYGVHAGFLIDIKPQEAGKRIGYKQLSDRKESLKRFSEGWKLISDEADGEITLYIENNVFSKTNSNTYKGRNPFLFSDFAGYLELKEFVSFRPLLDLAHLKVSSNSLGLNFISEVNKILPLTNYIHISDNDDFHDQNNEIKYDSNVLTCLKNFNFNDKTIVIEVYATLQQVQSSYEIVKNKLGVN